MKSISANAGRRTKILGLGLLLALLTTLLSGLLPPQIAHAVDECAQDAQTACVQGILRTADKEPVVGAEITLQGGSEDQTTTTADDGRWGFTVTEAGDYTVVLNVETLPDGQFVAQTDQRDITVEFNKRASALFPLTDDETAAADPDAEPGERPQATSSFSWQGFWQQFASGIRLGLLIALASVGLSLIFGTTGISNFAQGEMVSFGGIFAALFMTLTGNLWLAGLLAVISAGIFGLIQDMTLWRPLRKRNLSLMQLMIVSIGLSIFVQFAYQFFFTASIIRIDSRTPTTVNIFGVTMTNQSLVAMGISLVAIIAVGLALTYTRFGRATRAISDNPALAEASGINVNQVIRIVWIVGTALAGLAGVFLGLILNGINWFTGGQMLLLFFAAVTLGGLGTAFGAFVGSMIIGMVVELTNIWLPGDLKYATALLILILILLVRPQGLFGRKERIG